MIELMHVGISVRDLDLSIAFYREVFGMQVSTERRFGDDVKYCKVLGLTDARGRVAVLNSPGLQIELFQFDHPQPLPRDFASPVSNHGISHFCLGVEDLDREYERLSGAGVVFHCAPQEFPGKAKVTYARDPDGNVFELLEVLRSSDIAAHALP